MAKRKKLQDIPPYLDPDNSVPMRVQDLLNRMTLEEKIAETGFIMGNKIMKKGRFSPDLAKKFLGNTGIGGVMDPMIPGATTRKIINAIQKHLVTKTRLGIPALIMGECLHGHLSPGATIFPQAIGLSSSWDPEIV